MAIRNVRTDGNPVLREVCKEVTEVSNGIRKILDDMLETMYEKDGVGLAAPQIGIPKRMIVVDDREGNVFKLVNPVIIEEDGEQLSVEGCLSVPGFRGRCKRPMTVSLEALNENGEKVSIKAEGFLAVIFCHEIDHLNGILYKDKAVEFERVEDN